MTALTLVYAAEFAYGLATGQALWLSIVQAVILVALVALTARGYRFRRGTR